MELFAFGMFIGIIIALILIGTIKVVVNNDNVDKREYNEYSSMGARSISVPRFVSNLVGSDDSNNKGEEKA